MSSEVQAMWKQRIERDRVAAEREAARAEELDRLFHEPERRALQEYKEGLNGRRLTEEEAKEQAVRRTAASRAATEANRRREAWRRELSDKVGAAERDVEERVRRAHHLGGLNDDELEQFVAARTRADALRSLSAQLRRADDRAAEAQRNAILGNPRLAAV
ncbi:MAG: hypothetical protein WB565_07245 [Acidimicrobiales bacterium]